MRGSCITGIVLLVAALHVAVVGMLFGPRHAGYLVSAALSATLIWGGVFVLNERKRPAGAVARVVVGLAVQQVAYQIWRSQLGGFWWPLGQFGALQGLVARGIWRFAP
jgi:hypothetical protein